ncbi:hypothetical protein K1719_031030 [Acacia pycnantha]|nr:hypothetical protein K1719_031030 [Acacia pycnantha]
MVLPTLASICFRLGTLANPCFSFQEELVRSLERSHAQQSRLWRTVFAALFCCYILFLLYSILQQASSPWELKYHASRDGGALPLDEYNSRLGCCSSMLI